MEGITEELLKGKSNVMSLGELNNKIKDNLKDNFWQTYWIKASISKLSIKNHAYLNIVDGEYSSNAAIWASKIPNIGIDITSNNKDLYSHAYFMNVRVSPYSLNNSVSYSIEQIIDLDTYSKEKIEKEKLKKLYLSKGYFDPNRKRPIPKYCEYIAVIAAESGQAVQDVYTTVLSRFPIANLKLFNSSVQGQQALIDIPKQIANANKENFDVIIIARGGGSTVDLEIFNQEAIVNAIVESKIPIVTAIGHTDDISFSDLIADAYGNTPTGAAKLVVPDKEEILSLLKNYRARNQNHINKMLLDSQNKLKELAQKIYAFKPELIIEQYENKVNKFKEFIKNHKILLLQKLETKIKEFKELVKSSKELFLQKIQAKFEMVKTRFKNQALHSFNNQLATFAIVKEKVIQRNPLKILEKGFAKVTNENNQIIKTIEQVKVDKKLYIELKDGIAEVVVQKVNKK